MAHAANHPDPSAQERERAARRARNALRTTISTVLARGGSALVSFISLPLVVRYLGPERYGVWVTVASMASWLSLLDLGLGLGMRNQIAASTGRDDDGAIRDAVASASLLTLVPVLAGLTLSWVLAPRIDWRSLLNVGTAMDARELWLLVAVAASLILVTMWTSLGYAIVRALQRGELANYFSMGGAAVMLGATIWAAAAHAPLPLLALALLGPPAVAPLALWAWLAGTDSRLMPRFRATREQARALLGSGIGFLVLQIAVIVVFQFDLFIITRVCGPAQATPYAVGARVMALGTLAFGTYLSALWPAYSEAAARGDWSWVRTTHARMRKMVTGGAAAAGLGFALLAPWIVPLWAGPGARAGWPLYAWIAAASTIRAWTDVHAILLNGLNRLRPQIYSAVVHAAVTLTLSLAFAKRWGAVGVAAAGFFGFLLVSAWWLPLATRAILREEPGRPGGHGGLGPTR